MGMRERARMLGGNLEIRSGTGEGTRIEATVPLEELRWRVRRAEIRLLVADDHPMLREGLVAVLGTQPDFEVVGEAADGSEAVRLAETLRPDVILLDLEMPGVDGVAALERLRDAGPKHRARSSSPPTTQTSASWAPCAPGRAVTCSRAPPGRRSSTPSAPSTPAARCSSPA